MTVAALVVCTLAAALYALGGRGRRRALREVSFYAGIVSALVVLEPPFDGWADTSFALHMTQHVVLMTVTAPLLVLGRPWPRVWLTFPLRARRAMGRAVTLRFLARPSVALLLMSAALGAWHVPALYDAAVRSEWLHTLEHVCFVGTALLFWGALLEAPPVRARIDHLRRTAWFAAGILPGWILAIVLAFAQTPLYPAYGSLSDQQLAAGVMWVPGSLTLTIAVIAAFYRWLEPSPRPEELSWT
jgi:cytochrome c oxidase assembly factor CtaG